MVWKPGYQLQGGKYIIAKKLGRGGFGITYLASEPTGKLVVIKTLNAKVQQRPDLFHKCQQDFLNEALRLAKCCHRHIVGVDELIQESDRWCMVME